MFAEFRESVAKSPAHLRKLGIPYWQQALAGGLFTGLSPIASGTVASALAACLYYIPGCSNPIVLIGAAAVAFIVGFMLADRFEKLLGPDPSFFTLDEFAGQWLAMTSFWIVHPLWPILVFLCFRTFDIAKTWPASWFDRRRGGLGIMADDVVSAIYANISAHLIWFGLSLVGLVSRFLGE
ncbi:MAG: phosphatidylglycerophosphatase A [Chlorobi bacterium]|nr:phosphatidylglycerophosphatase A [Chlorobiota bacterium]